MKKKLLSLFICITMLTSAMLTGCGGQNGEETGEGSDAVENEQRDPMTLSLWVPTESGTTDEAIKLVESEINILTQAKYKTAIELHAIPADRYAAAVDSRVKEIRDNIEAEERAKDEAHRQAVENAIKGLEPVEEIKDDEDTALETAVDEFGQSITLYPDVSSQQLDIFLIKGYDAYKKYVDDKLLEELTGDLNNVGSKLTSYIHPSFFNVQDYDDGRYCVPNNHTIGKYQLLLVNKDLAEQYSYSSSELTTLLDCRDFIKDIGEQGLDGVVPLLGNCDPANVVYFSSDGQKSLIGQKIMPDVTAYDDLKPLSVLTHISGYEDTISMMKEMRSLGYMGDGNPDGKTFAVGVVEGDASLYDKYEDDYYISVHAAPVTEREDVFESVFAVSSFTKDVSRSMEIITYLNTDQTLRTLFQYGVEGVHWELDDTGEEPVLRRLNRDYMMNITDTGNTFITYPEEGVPMSAWDKYKAQNIDSLENPYIGLTFETADNKTQLKRLADTSRDMFARIDAMSYEEFQSSRSSINGEVMRGTGIVMSLISDVGSDSISDTIGTAFKMYYDSYLK